MCSEERVARVPGTSEPALCVSAVQRYSLHDGGGIRTVAFAKGCPFFCPWCCNPENLSFEPEPMWLESRCIGCSVRADGRRDRTGAPCDTAPESCPTTAKRLVGEVVSVEALAQRLLRDKVFFEESRGGVTVSGGECLAGAARQEAVVALLERCRAGGVHTAVETTLACELAVTPERLAAACDLLLVDFKVTERTRSREVTGIDPELRDANLRAVLACGAKVVARMPLIPGFTDDAANVRTNAERARSLGIVRADLLPFHQLGAGKYASVGRSYALGDVAPPSDEDVERAARICRKVGLEVVVRGA